MSKRVIALDVDGVLLDCDGAFAVVASELLDRPLHKLNNSYSLDVRYGISNDEVMEVFEYMNTHRYGWGGMPALPGAVNAFFQLRSQCDEIHLVTAIPEKLKDLRLSCLKEQNIIPDEIHCAGHHLASKVGILQDIKPFMFVDDRLRHLQEASFIEHRVFVDHGDSQDGLEVTDDIYQVKSLQQWANQWSLSQNINPRSRLKLIK